MVLEYERMELKDITKEAVLISENATFTDALRAMVNQQTNSLLVVNEDGVLTGEISVSDLLDAIVPEYLDGDSIAAHFATEEMFEEAVQDASVKPVSEFMAMDLEPVHVSDGLMAVAANAIAHQNARIAVVDDDNHPVGVVSRRGLKHILAQSLNIKDKS